MTFRLAHLSDAHIGPLPRPRAHELLGKRLTGYMNWRNGRRAAHDMDLLARIVADIHAHRPDHIAMTGDILNIGLPSEFPLARRWLETLGAPGDVSFTPGNHDAYVRGTMPDLARTFAPWTAGDDADAKHPGGIFPYLRVRGDIALIGLSSGIPTPPFIASGELGAAQRAALARLLKSTREKNLARIILIHHPPHRSGAPAGRALRDAARFEEIIRAHGAELILHGHNHSASAAHISGPGGARVPVIGVASCSALLGTHGHRAGWHMVSIERRGAGWHIGVHARGLRDGADGIGDLGAVFDSPPPLAGRG